MNIFRRSLVALVAVALLGVAARSLPQEPHPIDALRPGEWFRVPNSRLSAVVPDPVPPGITGPQSIMIAWNGAAYDTKRDRLLVWGGGHADYAGNELYAFDIASLTWSRIWGPSESIPTSGRWEAYPDGAPSSRHTYDGLTYIPTVDRFFSSNGSPVWLGNGSRATWLFNFSDMKWQRGADTPEETITSSSSYDPVTQHVFVQGNGIFAEYDPVANTYRRRGTVDGGMWSNPTSAIDPARRLFVMVGGKKVRVWSLNGFRYSERRTSGGDSVVGQNAPGFKYDPVRKSFIAWSGGANVYELDPEKWTWTVRVPAETNTVVPTDPPQQGTFSRFQYIPSKNAYIVVNSINQDVYIYKVAPLPSRSAAKESSGAPAPLTVNASPVVTQAAAEVAAAPALSPASTAVRSQPALQSNRSARPAASFRLRAPRNQAAAPFSVGLVFRKGALMGNPALDIPDQQVVVKKRWNDGSVKHAIASGHVALSGNRDKTISVFESDSPASRSLTAADIQKAGPAASVQLGNLGTVELSELLDTPFRTWVSGPEMVEAHYRSSVASDPSLSVWFHVRLFKGGYIWVRAIVENGYVNTPRTARTYAPVVVIGGGTVYDNSRVPLTHFSNTRWSAEGSIGTDPQIIPQHDSTQLADTRLVPNYWKRNVPGAAFKSLAQSYAPMQRGNLEARMGAAGFQTSIGLLPQWDALYVASGDERAYRATLANSSSLNSFPIVWRDAKTHMVARPAEHPSFAIDGGTYDLGAGPLVWEMNHAPSEGYLAYLLTGDYWHYETMMFNAALNYLALNPSRGAGVQRVLTAETRGTAWNLRTLTQAVAIAPDGDPVAANYQALLGNNMAHWKSVKDRLGGVGIGYLFEYNVDLYAPGTIAPWQQHFVIQSVGMGFDLEPLPDMAAYTEVRDWLYRAAVGILGDASGYCFNYASVYNIKISSGGNNSPSSWYPDWKTVFNSTHRNAACGNSLHGSSGAHPSAAATGYWGNLLPAIAYAVDHGAPGASEAWARLTGASNWRTIESSGFEQFPNWGIVPRTWKQ